MNRGCAPRVDIRLGATCGAFVANTEEASRCSMTCRSLACQTLARQLFAPPGAAGAHTRHLLAQAAGSHARLLDSAATAHQQPLDRLLAEFRGYLRGPAPPAEKRFVLDAPQLVEALHALAGSSDELAQWDAAVAPAGSVAPSADTSSLGCSRLGNVALALLLRRAPRWCGRVELATDAYGRIHIPFCDWTLVLLDQHDATPDLFADHAVLLDVRKRDACWSLPGTEAAPLLRMPRSTFDAMFVDNQVDLTPRGIERFPASAQVRFERASRLNHTPVRFEPIAREAPAARAEWTGAIVAALLSAIEQNAPCVHAQLCQCIRTIQGFELPPFGCGQIASFSVPTSPGIIGFNVQYTPRDEPQLSPYCFMWLGHELGHTLNYLIDDVAYTHGWRFLENPGETTPVIPRYGRALPVRTLFQVPYVHLFEWWLLMLFYERGFAGLPWHMFDDALAVGEDVRAEIAESFEWIQRCARLTRMGEAVLARMRELVAEAQARWRLLATPALRRRARQRATPRERPQGTSTTRERRAPRTKTNRR
jgi:hypothetical protein